MPWSSCDITVMLYCIWPWTIIWPWPCLDGLLHCHLPNGPTAHYKLTNVKFTKEIKVTVAGFSLYYQFILRININFTWGQFWPSGNVIASICLCVRPSMCHQDCLRGNSRPVQARITKFEPKVQNTLVKIPIVLRGNWPWPSRSNLT